MAKSLFKEGDDDTQYWPWWLSGSAVPQDSDIINNIYERATATPDLAHICKHDTHLLAVYGTLKKGFPLHEYMSKAAPMATVMSVHNRYAMLETLTPQRFPIVFDGTEVPHNHELANFVAELYLVPTSTLLALDTLEENGIAYQRQRVEFYVLGKDQVQTEAWTYLGLPKHWGRYIDNRRLAKSNVFTKNKPPQSRYYFFTKTPIENKTPTER